MYVSEASLDGNILVGGNSLISRNPPQIKGHSTCSNFDCRRQPTILVESKDGGRVTRNCPLCGRLYFLQNDVFLEKIDLHLNCKKCGKRMKTALLTRHKTFGYECSDCNVNIYLANLLPHYTQFIKR